jgi:hypothetical protein
MSKDNHTHVCLSCKVKQVAPDNPFGWCNNCFIGKPVELSKIRSRFFEDGKIPESEEFELILYTDRTGAAILTGGQNVIHKGFMLTHADIKLMFDKLMTTRSLYPDWYRHSFNLDNEIESLSHPACCQNRLRKCAKMVSGYVYIAYNSDISAYKIGLSKDPERRATNLKSKIVHIIPVDNMGIAEQKLHIAVEGKIASDLIDTHGYEWFFLSQSDVEYIKKITGYENGKFYLKENDVR